jgi:hypothetical protein
LEDLKRMNYGKDIEMKKRLLLFLVLLLALSISTIPGIAETQGKLIKFDLAGECTEFPGYIIHGDPEATFEGYLKEKDGEYYISPLKGTLFMNGVEYNFKYKQIKQSDPLYHYYFSHPPEYTVEDFLSFGEIEIEDWKSVGRVSWYEMEFYGNPSGGSALFFDGILDNSFYTCTLLGGVPVIE